MAALMGSNISLEGSARDALSSSPRMTETYFMRRMLSTICSTKVSRLASFVMPGRERRFVEKETSAASSD